MHASEFPGLYLATQYLTAKMCTAFEKLVAMPEYGGGYNSLTPGHANFIDQEAYQKLVDDHIMFKDMAADSYLAAGSNRQSIPAQLFSDCQLLRAQQDHATIANAWQPNNAAPGPN